MAHDIYSTKNALAYRHRKPLLSGLSIVDCDLWSNLVNELLISKPSKMIIENNKRDLQYYSHLFSQHCCNYKQDSNHWATKATDWLCPNLRI